MKYLKSTKFHWGQPEKLYFLILITFAFLNYPSKMPVKGCYRPLLKVINKTSKYQKMPESKKMRLDKFKCSKFNLLLQKKNNF